MIKLQFRMALFSFHGGAAIRNHATYKEGIIHHKATQSFYKSSLENKSTL